MTSVHQKHSLIKKWFQPALIYIDGMFGTAFLHPAFQYRELVVKEKGPLLLSSPM